MLMSTEKHCSLDTLTKCETREQIRKSFSGWGREETVPDVACFHSVYTVVLQQMRADVDQCVKALERLHNRSIMKTRK